MIPNINISNEKLIFINHTIGKIIKEANVPGKYGKNPTPKPVQKKN